MNHVAHCCYWWTLKTMQPRSICQKTSSSSIFWPVSWSQEPSALKSERFISAHNFRLCMLAGAYSMDKHPVLKSRTGRRDRVGREKGRARKRERVREGSWREILLGSKYNLQKHNTYSEQTVNNFLQLGSTHFFQLGPTHFLQLGPTLKVSLAYLIVPPSRDWPFN